MKRESINRCILISVAMGLLAMGPSSQAQHEDGAATATPPDGFHLGTRRNDETGKASFLLNGQPFYPFVYYENYRAVTPKLLAHLQSEGFNSIQIAVDACEAGSEDLKRVLQLLHRRRGATFVESAQLDALLLGKLALGQAAGLIFGDQLFSLLSGPTEALGSH